MIIKQTEESLTPKANYYNLFEFSPLPMWLFDVKTLRFLAVNVAATKHYGYSNTEFLSMTIQDIRRPEDVSMIQKVVKENILTQNFHKNTYKHIKKNGEQISVTIESNSVDFEGHEARLVLITDITEKLKVENDLLLSEQRFKALVQDGSDMIAILDENLNYIYVSPTSLRILGTSPEIFIGNSALNFIHQDDQERLMSEAEALHSMINVEFTPFRFRNANGDWRWIETKATNLSHDPAIKGIVCNSNDVTERIENEFKLNESIERFNLVSQATSETIWDMSLMQDTIVWNKGIKDVFKYDTKNTDIDFWRTNIHPEDKKRVLTKFDKHIKNSISHWQDEYRFGCGDGSFKYVFDRGFLLLNASGKPYRMIGAMLDITKRKEEEHWSKLLESVVINTTDGVVIMDANPNSAPNIMYVNEATSAIYGYSKSELIGQSPGVFHGSNVDQPGLKEIYNAIQTKKPINVELINYSKSGREFFVNFNFCPITDGTGTITHWVSILRDITESKNYVKAIEEQNKALKEIAWMQSHMVRAPLARIIGLVDLLKNDCSVDDKNTLLNYLCNSASELDKVIIGISNNTIGHDANRRS